MLKDKNSTSTPTVLETAVQKLMPYHVRVIEVARFGNRGKVAFIVTIELDNVLDAVPGVVYIEKVTCQVACLGLSRVVRLQHRHTDIARQCSHNTYCIHKCHQNYGPLKWRTL